MDLIKYLKADKLKRKLTFREMSDELEVSASMLYFVMNGKSKAGVKTMRKIAKYYNIPIESVVIMNDSIK